MIYKTITKENFNEIETIMQRMKTLATERFAEDKYSAQATEYICIMGEDAINLFDKKFSGVIKKEYAPTMRTDEKTVAKSIPYVTGHYCYYITRDGSNGRFSNFNDWGGIKALVEIDGVLLYPHRADKTTKSFSLWNDNTDYRNYLPSEWEKNNPEPTKVGVISDKKIRAWKDWLCGRKNAAEAEMKRREKNVADFLAKIEAIPESECLRKQVGDVRGEIVRNGLCYSWEISYGIVYDKLKVHYTTAWKDGKTTFDAFKEMVVGKYVGKL